jgi:Mrp family chromosome partitioning ATPase
MRSLLALARAGGVLIAVALLLLLVPAARVASSSFEVLLEGRAPETAPLPLESARNLREAMLDRETVLRLTRESAGQGASDEALVDAAARVDRAIDVVTADGKTFHVVVSDVDGERAARVSKELAALAVARAAVASPACREPCRVRAHVSHAASRLDVPADPTRAFVLVGGILIALVAGVLPLVAPRPVAPREPRFEGGEGDDVPRTERLPSTAPKLSTRTLPLAAAGPAGDARRATSSRPPPAATASQRPPSAPPPVADAPGVSPIMGYAASTFRPEPGLNPGAREALVAELRQASSDDCLIVAVSAAREPAMLGARLATELAIALALAGDRRLLLIESDFRNPGIAQLLNLPGPEGVDFASELGRRASGSGVEPLSVLICSETLHVLPSAGAPSADLVLTTHFEACWKMTRDYYDIVIVRAPSTSAGVYLTAVADAIDGIIIAGDDASRLPPAAAKKAFVRVVPA